MNTETLNTGTLNNLIMFLAQLHLSVDSTEEEKFV
jgi:hypothetical protein